MILSNQAHLCLSQDIVANLSTNVTIYYSLVSWASEGFFLEGPILMGDPERARTPKSPKKPQTDVTNAELWKGPLQWPFWPYQSFLICSHLWDFFLANSNLVKVIFFLDTIIFSKMLAIGNSNALLLQNNFYFFSWIKLHYCLFSLLHIFCYSSNRKLLLKMISFVVETLFHHFHKNLKLAKNSKGAILPT